MSLWLGVIVHNPQTGKRESVEMPPGSHLMGFESYRQELWGTEIMTRLGLKLLAGLSQGGYLLLKTPEEIAQLEHEAIVIRDNMDLVRQALPPHIVDALEQKYLPNLFNAVTLAQSVHGEISIG